MARLAAACDATGHSAWSRGVACPGAATDRRSHVHLWEVGANLGDCSLWAAAVLSGRLPGRLLPPLSLTLRAYEPLPATVGTMRRSVDAFVESLEERYRASGATPSMISQALPRINVVPVALSDEVGTQVLGVPLHSAAESTAHNCSAQYDGFHGCDFVKVNIDMLDEHFPVCRAESCEGVRQLATSREPPLLDL
eukprot:CAMPEP_0203922340 /NCGR_PEP_ID=MMETSP0359-20131031/62375_1 /ASSEMBLY_ACC=CAM_ASM_000338 /TAXON_ID=268821 /ORGANISM="Scrippsiella Hangoei, Strain SHTV-5" /LENGTH=194 /DNA_ID=CAMNT_0050850193 /DNA_START=46 /DNA_END=627 /DNA_ORIENTATION=-